MAGKDARALDPASLAHGCALPSEVFPDWKACFGRSAPLELEIGPGHGHFALDHAAGNPFLDLVCIETRRVDCELIRERARERGLANLIVLQGDAKLLLPRLFPPGSLSGLHVQFPDPWWKRRHRKRRMVDAELALRMRTLLRPGGAVDFRTDVPAYAQAALGVWEETGFENAAGKGKLWTDPPEVLSTRERRYLVTGQPVFRARFVNPGPPEGELALSATGRDWTDVRRK
ncbi:MAG: tRNA (guanosine(46)-N7)-methyltransferase TrmB [Deltaproteobacteria bacterium]|nr:MAG: tRNA (guanosine(46)-N7)-methyltransferase TrmB [Deltaproteobacteria bacterium]